MKWTELENPIPGNRLADWLRLIASLIDTEKDEGLIPLASKQVRSFRLSPVSLRCDCRIVSVTDRAHLPGLAGLWLRLRQFGFDEFRVLDLWGDAHAHFPKLPGLRFFTAEELDPAGSPPLGARRRAFTLKPALIERVFRDEGSPVLYSDVDMHFLESPWELIERVRQQTALLFPHFHRDAKREKEHGLYNAGLLLFGEKGLPALQWWKEACRTKCVNAPRSGHYYDQKYLEEMLIRFPEVEIDRSGSHNIGPWTHPGRIRALRSIHVSAPDEAGRYLEKYLWDDLCAFLLEIPPHPLHRLEILRRTNRGIDRILRARHWLARASIPLPPSWLSGFSSVPMLNRFLEWGERAYRFIKGPGESFA